MCSRLKIVIIHFLEGIQIFNKDTYIILNFILYVKKLIKFVEIIEVKTARATKPGIGLEPHGPT